MAAHYDTHLIICCVSGMVMPRKAAMSGSFVLRLKVQMALIKNSVAVHMEVQERRL